MRAMRLLGAAGLLALAGVGAGTVTADQAQPAPQPLPASPRNPTLAETQALFDSYVATGKVPGMTGAFGVGDSATQFVSAGRIAEGADAPAAGPDSLWRIYSMTKPITGMAAMILIEEGKLGLDDPLSKYFPAFARMRVLTSPDTSLASVPAKTQITIRELLTHTAGLTYSITAKGPLLKEVERLGLLPGTMNMAVEAQARVTRPKSLAEFANRVATVPLIAEPGTTWSYSMGLDVLGAVIEQASGMTFDAFVQTKLFDPLAMKSTYWTVPATEVGRLSTNYVFAGERRAPIDPGATSVYLSPPSFLYGGAGLVSTARDYDRFLHMLANGGTLGGVRVMKPETVALAMSNLLPPGVAYSDSGSGTGDRPATAMGFGAGGSVYLADAPNGGPSKGTYGWGGAAGTIAWVDPVRKMRGVVMVQYFPFNKWPLRTDVGAALARDAMRLHGR